MLILGIETSCDETAAAVVQETGDAARPWTIRSRPSAFANALTMILDACRCGDAEVVLSLPARAAVLLHDLFPGLTADLAGLVNRLLPGPGGIGAGHARGFESESAAAPSMLTALTERAARENNEMGLRPPVAGAAAPPSGS